MGKIKIAVIGAVVVALVLVAGVVTFAANGHRGASGPAGAALQRQAGHQSVAAQTKVKKSVAVTGFSGATLTAGGFTPIDAAATLTCPGTTGSCTYEADASVQAQGTGSSNAWAICLVIDGNNFATCPYYGFLDSSFFQEGTVVSVYPGIPHGTHTVQTQVFSANGGTAYNYNIVYNVYKP
jgi:hypothetical protein